MRLRITWLASFALVAVAATGCKREHGASGLIRFKDASFAKQLDGEAMRIASPRVLGRVVLARGLGQMTFWGKSDQAALDKLAAMVTARAHGDRDIDVFVKDTDAKRAIDTCNSLLGEYLADRVEEQRLKAGPTAGFHDVQFHNDANAKACTYR